MKEIFKWSFAVHIDAVKEIIKWIQLLTHHHVMQIDATKEIMKWIQLLTTMHELLGSDYFLWHYHAYR